MWYSHTIPIPFSNKKLARVTETPLLRVGIALVTTFPCRFAREEEAQYIALDAYCTEPS
jgi:hypothetical protein